MDIKKRCQWCGEPFIAHKMTTLYCSKLCIDRAYKAKEKEKIKEEKLNELSSTFPIVESIGQKPFMTPREAAKLLGIGKTTMYRYMAQGIIKVFRTPARTIVRRSDLEALFDNAPAYVKRVNKKHKVDSETYTMRDIMEKYNITKKCAMRRIDKYDIPKIYEGRNVSYSKALVDKYFAELADEINMDDYYTPDQMMNKFNMSRS
ncbi:MAG: helix-turn-helix domain-containing protein, partial [Prevotella sp.]|nr:helix-turn-helix domain-containing protein [Prevotella sp.]